MNKVLQSAGRVIRTTEDTGVVVLLDERFRLREYQELFPREWADCRICTLQDVSGQVHAFWNFVEKQEKETTKGSSTVRTSGKTE